MVCPELVLRLLVVELWKKINLKISLFNFKISTKLFLKNFRFKNNLLYNAFMNFLKTYFVGFLFLLAIVLFAPQARAEGNLLVNPGAETGDATGWIILENGGDGWSFDFDDIVNSGTKSFQSSYGLTSMSQTVNLVTSGYTAYQLDVRKPTITATIYTRTRADQAGRYYEHTSF